MPQQPCHHHADRISGRNTVPIVAGLFVLSYGLFGALLGGMSLISQDTDKGETTATMSLIGGLFLLLTGLWFMTRSSPTSPRVIGLLIMLCGVLCGTYLGRSIANEPGEGHIDMANLAFLSGLLIHLAGVIFIVKARE